MALVNLGANQDAVIVLFLLPSPLAGPLLSIYFGPSHGVFVGSNLISGGIRLHGSGCPPGQAEGSGAAGRAGDCGGEASAGLGGIEFSRGSARWRFGHLKRMSLLGSHAGAWGLQVSGQ